ncbi:MAG: DUF2061 domain-containing protein [Gammaproteobacteria bacterium]|nr:DUF2061 domain-containing protein [Gammaproteobacteria bacterium]
MTKTVSFAIVHFTVAFTVGYALSGSILVGGAIALVEPTINTVAYHLHEKVWQRVERRREASPQGIFAPATSSCITKRGRRDYFLIPPPPFFF